MQTKEFIDKLKEALDVSKHQVDENTVLRSIEGYDSMSVMAIIALVDELFSKRLLAKQLADLTTVKSLMDLIGSEHFSS